MTTHLRLSLLAMLGAAVGCGVPAPPGETAAGLTVFDPTSCGHAGQPCCPPNGQAHYACNGDGSDTDYYSLQCNNGMCERCGMPGLKCCTLNKLFCRGDDPTNEKYTCRNDVCEYTSGAPPKPTCNGIPAGASAQVWAVPVRHADSKCGEVFAAFANSATDAQACATAAGWELTSGSLQWYDFAQRSNVVANHCATVEKPAYSSADAQACASFDCQDDSCTALPGACPNLGWVANLPPPPPAPSCTIGAGCECQGQVCGTEVDIGCATIAGTQVAQVQLADGTWSTFASAAPNARLVLFRDLATKGAATYRVCDVDGAWPTCTAPMAVTVAANSTCGPPPPPNPCKPGYHWCGDDEGCYPKTRLCD